MNNMILPADQVCLSDYILYTNFSIFFSSHLSIAPLPPHTTQLTCHETTHISLYCYQRFLTQTLSAPLCLIITYLEYADAHEHRC